MEHDPLTNPQPGDAVSGMGKIRDVISRTGGDIRYVVRNQKVRTEKYCWISTWCDWCARNKAIVVG